MNPCLEHSEVMYRLTSIDAKLDRLLVEDESRRTAVESDRRSRRNLLLGVAGSLIVSVTSVVLSALLRG